jgi:hypothetical protein
LTFLEKAIYCLTTGFFNKKSQFVAAHSGGVGRAQSKRHVHGIVRYGKTQTKFQCFSAVASLPGPGMYAISIWARGLQSKARINL